MTFSGYKRLKSNINLNITDHNKDYVNIFIFYRLKNRATNHFIFANGLFGHDNGGWDKFVCFDKNSSSMLIAGAYSSDQNGYVVIGPNSVYNKQSLGNYPNNANAGELNKWISLSFHWNVPDGSEGSFVCCNGKNIGNFTAVHRTGSNYLAFGDINTSGTVNLDGDIAMFAVYKEFKMRVKVI